MAEVHLARQRGPRRFQKLVVVKTVHSKLATKPSLAEALLDEARIAALVKHPNVIDIYDLGEERGTYFIAMEYLEGESLATVLRTARGGARLDPFSTTRIIADCALGLHAAHELTTLKGEPMELVHQDVTPGNVIVLYTGQVKLVDFGVAKVRTSADAGLVKGKAGYLAPELFEGNPADRRSDVFALGVVLWEALTLRRLFHSATERETFDKIRAGNVPPPSRFAPAVTRDLDEACLRALASDPTARYPTARAMHDDLAAVLRAANWGGDNEPIARFMRTTFAPQIAARAELLRELDADEAPRPDVLETITGVGFDPARTPDDEAVVGAHGVSRLPLPPPRPPTEPTPGGGGTGELLDPADLIDIATPISSSLPVRRRSRLPFVIATAAVIGAVAPLVAIGTRTGDTPDALAAAAPGGDAGVALVAPIDAAPVVIADDPDAAVAVVEVAVDAGVVPVAPVEARRADRTRPPDRAPERAAIDAAKLTTAKSLYKDGLQRFVGGDTGAAIGKFQAALDRDPGYAPAHRGLGMAYERKGDRSRATRAFKRYLELAPDAPDAAAVRDRLEKLR